MKAAIYYGNIASYNMNGQLNYYPVPTMATLYVSPYLVASSQNYTKHYYAGSERIASKIGGGGIANITTPIVSTDYKRNSWTQPYANLWSSCLNLAAPCSTFFYSLLNAQPATSPETALYFYHSDHLGSASWITDSSGSAIQHLQYLPFGETWVDQRITSTSWNTKYSFSAKEKDEESRYSYFGARYYDSELSIWLSVDPMTSEYPGLSPFVYCHNNPIKMIDPNGMFDIETGTVEKGDNLTKIANQINEKYNTKLTAKDLAKGNNIKDANKIQVGDKIALPGQNAELNFDLKELKVTDATYGIDMPCLSWEGTSGREGFQSPEFQSAKDKGPIPEGSYMLDPSKTQSYSSLSITQKLAGPLGFGQWRGGKNAWGEHRTWLTPMSGTNTFGRDNFSIHGGKTPGSAGCIDLTKNNNSFHSWLKSYGKPIQLNVKY